MGFVQRICFFAGLLLILVASLIELGSAGQFGHTGGGNMPRPGLGIPYLASLDLLMVYTLVLLSLDELGPIRAVLARVQGVVTFILCLLGLLVMIAMIFLALSLITLMVSMFVAVPFGTIAYLAIWGNFETGQAHRLLSVVMTFKLFGAGLLLFSRPLFLKNIGFVLLLATTLVCTLLLGILHSWFPRILVSITDSLGAIVIGILAAIWLIVFLIGAIPAIVNAIRSVVPKPS